MQTPRIRTITGAPATLLLSLVAFVAPAVAAERRPERDEGARVAGQWMIDFEKGDGRAQLTLQRSSPHGHSSNSSAVALSEIGLAQRPSSSGPARFAVRRDAGTIAFEGHWSQSGGGGEFVFTPDPEYALAMREMGYGDLSLEEQYSAAVHDLSRAFLRDLASLGYRKVSFDDLVAMRIHGAGPPFIRALAELGYRDLPVDDLVSMRIHGAGPEFVKRLSQLGLDRIAPDDLVSMRIHGVAPEFVAELQRLGYRPTPDELVSMRIHGVSAEFIRGLAEIGYRQVAIDDLVSMRIHGVTLDFARRVRARDRSATPDDLVSRRIHGRE